MNLRRPTLNSYRQHLTTVDAFDTLEAWFVAEHVVDAPLTGAV